MGYELEAYVVPLEALEGGSEHPIPETFYRLTEDLALIPLAGDTGLTGEWPREASAGRMIARVSAHYFGGAGSQKASVWRDGEVIAEKVEVNDALRLLGVVKSGGDEWDTVGLDRFRRTQTWAAAAIRETRNRGGLSLEPLLQALGYESWDKKLQEKVRSGAAHDLAELGDPAAIPHLAGALDGDEYGLAIAAAGALAALGPSGVFELGARLREAEREAAGGRRLLRWLRKPKPFPYFPIVHALGEAGADAEPYAVDVAKLLGHADTSTCNTAAQALGEMGPAAKAAVPWLIEALDAEPSYLRSYAARALGAIGPAARAAADRLRACLDDESPGVRESAQEALDAIENER